MHEPTSLAASGSAAISAAVLVLIGVPYLALLWGFIGAFAMVIFTPSDTTGRAVATVIMSGLIGAAAGNWFASAMAGGASAVLILSALIAGAGAKPLLSIAIAAVVARIQKAGGQ